MSSLAVGSPDHGLGISAQFSMLVDLFEWRARFQSDRVAYTFLTDNGTDRIQHLAGAPALLNFPTDRPRPAVQKFQGESQTLVLDGALAESLKILSRRQGATLFMTLLAAFKMLLFRSPAQSRILAQHNFQYFSFRSRDSSRGGEL